MYRQPEQGTIARRQYYTASPRGWRLLFSRFVTIRSSIASNLPLLGLIVAFAATGVDAQPGPVQEQKTEQERIFATVNGESIRLSTYQTTLHLSARQHFYHGQPPEEDLRAFRKEVGERLIDESVMHQEALRRGIEPDAERVNADVNKNVKRLSAQKGWDQVKDHLVPVLRAGLERNDRIRQLKDALRRAVPSPSEEEVRTYYEANLDKFTSPPQTRISMIMLKVPPWGDTDAWSQRRDELGKIKHEISGGLEFSEAARRYSDDSSASSGGDMGYLHEGMLGAQAEAAIAVMKVGEISDPVTLLEGVALFQLNDRAGVQVNPLEKVHQRASELLMREKQEAAVVEGVRQLRDKADVRYTDPEYYELRQEVKGRSDITKS